jgi:hypothetical protein
MRILLATAMLLTTAAAAPAATNVELLHGTVRSGAHSASGRAAVVLTSGKRVLTLRSFRIAPGPKVRVYLVPRGVRGDADVRRDYKDLGALKGSKGNQQYAIAASVDLRRYRSVIFWCVPFTSTLARANLTPS